MSRTAGMWVAASMVAASMLAGCRGSGVFTYAQAQSHVRTSYDQSPPSEFDLYSTYLGPFQSYYAGNNKLRVVFRKLEGNTIQGDCDYHKTGTGNRWRSWKCEFVVAGDRLYLVMPYWSQSGGRWDWQSRKFIFVHEFEVDTVGRRIRHIAYGELNPDGSFTGKRVPRAEDLLADTDEHLAGQPAQRPEPEGAPGEGGLRQKLEELKKLRDDGLINDAEYEAKKSELLKAY